MQTFVSPFLWLALFETLGSATPCDAPAAFPGIEAVRRDEVNLEEF